MKLTNLLLAALCAGTLLGGCKGKDGDPGPAGPAGTAGPAGPTGPIGPNLTGNMVGFLNVYDEFGRAQAKNGVTVTAENTTPLVTATTDANGRYELTNLRSGTYNIAFSKTGYGTTKVQGYPHAGGDQPAFLYTREIIGVSSTAVQNLAISQVQFPAYNGDDYHVLVYGNLTNPNRPAQYSVSNLQAALFVGSTSAVTAATGKEFGTIRNSQQSYPNRLSRTDLNAAGFATGTTAYAVAYGAPGGSYYYYGGYTDVLTGRPVYTGLNATPSQVVSFIVP